MKKSKGYGRQQGKRWGWWIPEKDWKERKIIAQQYWGKDVDNMRNISTGGDK